jgi:hypothetical protein
MKAVLSILIVLLECIVEIRLIGLSVLLVQPRRERTSFACQTMNAKTISTAGMHHQQTEPSIQQNACLCIHKELALYSDGILSVAREM